MMEEGEWVALWKSQAAQLKTVRRHYIQQLANENEPGFDIDGGEP